MGERRGDTLAAAVPGLLVHSSYHRTDELINVEFIVLDFILHHVRIEADRGDTRADVPSPFDPNESAMMPTYLASTRNAYQRSAVLTASKGQLVVMLYDGAHRFLSQASLRCAAQHPHVPTPSCVAPR